MLSIQYQKISLAPGIILSGTKIVKFDGISYKQEKMAFKHESILYLHTDYEIKWRSFDLGTLEILCLQTLSWLKMLTLIRNLFMDMVSDLIHVQLFHSQVVMDLVKM